MDKRKTKLLAIRLEVLPGKSVVEKFTNAERYGFDAVELPGRYLTDYRDELLNCRNELPLKVSSISLGFRGSLLSADALIRKQCCEDIKGLLDLCAKLGAVGLVMPPVLNMDNQERLPDFGNSGGRREREDFLILEQLPELAQFAKEKGVVLMLEPVNRLETDYLNTLEHAVRLCHQVNNSGLGITADWFHMHLEEADMAGALRQCGKWLKHFHVSEIPDRTEPAEGGLDFRTAFDVLAETGYQGYTVFECRGLSGPAETVLPRSVEYLQSL